MKHLADEFDLRGLIRILLFKLHHQSEGAVLERCIGRPDDNGVPNGRVKLRGDRIRPEVDAYQVITLSGIGDAETPAGGSVCIRCRDVSSSKPRVLVAAPTLKSRIKRRRAAVDMAGGVS